MKGGYLNPSMAMPMAMPPMMNPRAAQQMPMPHTQQPNTGPRNIRSGAPGKGGGSRPSGGGGGGGGQRKKPAPAPPSAVAEESSLGDTKTQLAQFCQKFCQRPLTKDDISYMTNRFGDQYQTIVELKCLQGEQFAGETKSRPKEAERAAAAQALQAHVDDIAKLPPRMTREQRMNRKKDPEQKANKQVVDPENNPALTPKVRLNELCMKIAQRYLKKGESVYTSRQVLGGFQATVQLKCLPDEWSQRLWAGEVCTTKQKAEQSAADIAMQQITGDAKLMELAETSALGKGKGKGKGGWGLAWMLDFWNAGGPDLPRENMETGLILGEVIDWKDNYGWIKAKEKIDHPAAGLRNGRIYVNAKDVKGGSLKVEQTVRFQIYVDNQGLGATDVEIV